MKPVNNISGLIKIIKYLRSDKGCEWDRKQTIKTLLEPLIEEIYEYLDAVYSNKKNKMQEEIGDLLFLLLTHIVIADEKNMYDLKEVVNTVSSKLIYRHPHVFSNKKVKDTDEILINWEKLKNKQNNTKKIDLPKKLPALQKAIRFIEKDSRLNKKMEKRKTKITKTELLNKQWELLKLAYNNDINLETEMQKFLGKKIKQANEKRKKKELF